MRRFIYYIFKDYSAPMSELIKKFLKPLSIVKRRFLIMTITTTYQAFLAIFAVKVLQYWVDAMISWSMELIYKWVYIWIWLASVFYFFKYFIVRTNDSFAYIELADYLKRKYMKKVMLLEQSYYEIQWTWKLIHIIRAWVLQRASLLRDIYIRGLEQFLTIVLWLVSIRTVWWEYWLWAIGYILLLVWVFLWLQPFFKKYRSQRKDVWIENSRHQTKMLMTKTEILINNRVWKMVDYLYWLTQKEKVIKHSESRYTEGLHSIPSIISIWVYIMLMIFLWSNVIEWKNTVGDFVLFTGLIGLIEANTRWLLALILDVHNKFIDVDKLRDTVDNAPVVHGRETWKEFNYISWNITFDNVSFWYKDREIFDEFSISIESWKKIALVWPSWGWKSTFLKLIAWLLHSNTWHILVDDQKLTDISFVSYYGYIGYLAQDSGVFDWTIRENLTFWLNKEDWNIKEVISDIIEKSQCLFIYELENWIHTEIWERWVRLSWWQKQRLAIAKLMIKNPSIILLDEPTSALDSISESAVTIAMDNLFKWRTVIVIAHRLQTVMKSDDIIVIDQWKVIERWTHIELIKKSWSYAEMLELQSGF